MLEKFSKWKANETNMNMNVQKGSNIPTHVAIIMDGSGRWAKQKGLPRIAGHREGMKSVNKIVRKANELGIKVLTLYAFSTENWKRPKKRSRLLIAIA